ncbi:MAG: STAS domain-containing protein, partial [Chitinivibrionales bacterium]|nr:STAS domain-containing protein [Chitinivibrionales bacterium]MBD3357213.1 STAS domain-containing protein [Chitinivibrionales bacterium]
LNGDLVEESAQRLKKELTGLLKAPWKSIALLMKSIRQMDESALKVILDFHDEYLRLGRYSAILDPSPQVDEFLLEHKDASRLDVFGTEKTFEERAFATTREIELRKKNKS